MRFLNEIKLLDLLPDASMSAQRESSTVIFYLQKFASESNVIETRGSKKSWDAIRQVFHGAPTMSVISGGDTYWPRVDT